MKFDMLIIKASELEIMVMKTGIEDEVLMLLAEETIEMLEKFTAFVGKFKDLRSNCMLLGFGTLSPIVPDHFIREQMYFVSKIKSYMSCKRD